MSPIFVVALPLLWLGAQAAWVVVASGHWLCRAVFRLSDQEMAAMGKGPPANWLARARFRRSLWLTLRGVEVSQRVCAFSDWSNRLLRRGLEIVERS